MYVLGFVCIICIYNYRYAYIHTLICICIRIHFICVYVVIYLCLHKIHIITWSLCFCFLIVRYLTYWSATCRYVSVCVLININQKVTQQTAYSWGQKKDLGGVLRVGQDFRPSPGQLGGAAGTQAGKGQVRGPAPPSPAGCP